MDADGLGHLVADGLQRVERGHRLLEDHADVAAADRAHARASPSGSRSPPSSTIGRAARRRAAAGRMTASAVIDLPEPLSPMTPSTSPRGGGRWRRGRGSAGRGWRATGPRRRGAAAGHARTRRRRGSSRSRRPSPIRLRPSTVRTIARPGTSASQGAKAIIVWLSASIRPQDGVGGWAPRPT